MWKTITKKQKAAVFLCSLFLILNVSIVGTMAYLITMTEPAINTFTPAAVPNEITEKFDDAVKNDVKVKNVGDADAYIRVKVIPTWAELDAEGNATGSVHAAKPVYGVDFVWCYQNPLGKDDTADYTSGTMEQVGKGWVSGLDGYYYYTQRVSCKENQNSTQILFTGCKPCIDQQTGRTPNQPEGYALSIEILSQSVQADGTDKAGIPAVTEAWGITVNADGTLKAEGGK